MKSLLPSLLIACVAVVSCDKPTPCDTYKVDLTVMRSEILSCQSNACVEWIMNRVADEKIKCEESKRDEVRN